MPSWSLLLQIIFLTFVNGEEEDFIVGGINAKIEDAPYQVAIINGDTIFCGGSVISKHSVLSAAHCFAKMKKNDVYSIRAGSTYAHRGGQKAKVARVCTHPRYNKGTSDFDVAVLRLDRNLQFGRQLQPIRLPFANTKISLETFAIVSGWGLLKNNGQQPEILQKVAVPKIDKKLCKLLYRPKPVTRRMACYGYSQGGRDSCQGDSGGPLVVNNVQVGIVSWGFECAKPNSPGIYTDLTNPQILSHISFCIARDK